MGEAKTQLWGVIGSEPRVREVGEQTVITCSVATDDGYGDRKVTTWWNVEVWTATNKEKRLNYLTHALGKGARIWASGTPVLRPYTDSQGLQRYSLDLKRADVGVIVAAPREQDVTQAPRPAAPEPELYDSSIPF